MEQIEDLLARDLIQRVSSDPRAVARLLADAERHLATAGRAIDSGDLAGAYQLAYDAARKALTALLLRQGMRTRGPGAHANLIIAVQELHAGSPGLDDLTRFDRIRRVRNRSEYGGYEFDEELVRNDLAIARTIVDAAAAVA